MVTLTSNNNENVKIVNEYFQNAGFGISKGSGEHRAFSFKYGTLFVRFFLNAKSVKFSKNYINLPDYSEFIKFEKDDAFGKLLVDFDGLKAKLDIKAKEKTQRVTNKNIANFKETLYLALLNEHLKPIFGEY